MNDQQRHISKNSIATAIAILFHAIGLVGILYFDRQFFIQATPYNLLLMFTLVVWTQQDKNVAFYLFILICVIAGILVEVVGVHTGLLFGDYRYGSTLGVQVKSVPLIIGINWFIIVYCCGMFMHTLLRKLGSAVMNDSANNLSNYKSLSIIFDGATVAVFFDWIMEPVAVKLGYWYWKGSGAVPFFNYACWFIISVLLLYVFNNSSFHKSNKFAVHLLLIQMMFFLLLRVLLD